MLKDKILLENLINLKFLTPELLLTLKILVLAFSFVFFISICRFLKVSSWVKFRFLMDLSEFLTYRPYGAKKFDKIWSGITKKLDLGSESEHKLAIIEADAILNEVLERIGIKGETLGERLKNVTANILPSINEAWEAHKTRNNIVHDPDYKLTLDQAKKTISIYEKCLRDLQVF